MAINKVNNTTEEKSFNFLENQSSILRTVDTNNITVNGVNVIVDKPKRGDIMCITKYKDTSGNLLDADKQKVIWIDGLSINPKYLSQEYEAVGICFVVNGNKALVRYRKEMEFKWSALNRLHLSESPLMNDGIEHTFTITVNGIQNPHKLVSKAISRSAFVFNLNTWFSSYESNYRAELVELNTDEPAKDISDIKDGNSYRNRIVINAKFRENSFGDSVFISTDNAGVSSTNGISNADFIKSIDWYYINSGYVRNMEGGCCRTKYYDYIQQKQYTPEKEIKDLDGFSGGILNGKSPVRKKDFENHKYCQFLRDNFSNYDEYFESMLVKFPCGAGGSITELPSGKENTYKLANCTYSYGITQKPLYPAANYAASISLNAPKLGKGNWWLPSTAEMVQMMRDINDGDIINRVLRELCSWDSNWSFLSQFTSRWTSSKCYQNYAYFYSGERGLLDMNYFNFIFFVSPITIYEF